MTGLVELVGMRARRVPRGRPSQEGRFIARSGLDLPTPLARRDRDPTRLGLLRDRDATRLRNVDGIVRILRTTGLAGGGVNPHRGSVGSSRWSARLPGRSLCQRSCFFGSTCPKASSIANSSPTSSLSVRSVRRCWCVAGVLAFPERSSNQYSSSHILGLILKRVQMTKSKTALREFKRER